MSWSRRAAIKVARALAIAATVPSSAVALTKAGSRKNPTQSAAANCVDAIPLSLNYPSVSALLRDTAMGYVGTSPRCEVSIGGTVRAENFIYEVADAGVTDHHLTTAGGIKLYVRPVEVGYVAAAFGSKLDEVTAQAAFDAVVAQGKSSMLRFTGDWTINSTVTIGDPNNVTVDARGAYFKLTSDTLMFDLNGRADPTFTDNESRQNFHWKGGRFGCSVASPTMATAFRALGFRHASIEVDDFGLSGGPFYRDIIAGAKDTFHIGGHKTRNPTVSIELPPWGVSEVLNFHVDRVHNSLTNNGQFIKSYAAFTDSSITNFSCNMGSNAANDGAIDLMRSLCFGLSSLSGTFSPGEQVTGGTSGATAEFVEVYTHDFAFDISQHLSYIVLKRRDGTFAAGETLVGVTSAATAVIADDKSPLGYNAYVTQNRNWQNVNIGGSVHWEAGAGANGAVCVKLRDMDGGGSAPVNFHIDLGSVGVNGGGAVGLLLERISYAEITGRFALTSGNTPIKFDSDCGYIKIKGKTFFSTGKIDLNGMSRDYLDLTDFNKVFSGGSFLTGWAPKIMSTKDGTLLEMSAEYSKFFTVGGLPPKAYEVTLQAKDRGSNSSAPRIRVWRPHEKNSNRFAWLDLSGVPDNALRSAGFLVGADASGNIKYDSVSSGTDTLVVTINIRSMIF